MNIAFFLTPKCNVEYLYEDDSLKQGLEKIKFHGYTSIPVINKEGKYVGSVSEGDFLHFIIENECGLNNIKERKNFENAKIKSITRQDKNPPVLVTSNMEALLVRAMEQNYIPVVDDRGTFMGIVTRRDIIKYFYKENFIDSNRIAYCNPELLQSLAR